MESALKPRSMSESSTMSQLLDLERQENLCNKPGDSRQDAAEIIQKSYFSGNVGLTEGHADIYE
jgi:hypothetical protein